MALLKAWFEDYGLDVELIHVADEAEQVTHYFNELKDSHDVIITTGARIFKSEKDHHCYLLGLPGNPAAVYVSMQSLR